MSLLLTDSLALRCGCFVESRAQMEWFNRAQSSGCYDTDTSIKYVRDVKCKKKS